MASAYARAVIEDVGGWPTILGRLSDGESLDANESEATLATILAGEATDAQIAAFIVALRIKGETPDELAGLANAMMATAETVPTPDGAIDIVGAGGGPTRQRHALNVSTMACFVAAGAGAVICKHGNRKASSTSGSFDLLEALGVNIDLTPAQLERCIADAGLGFAYARTHHPAMRFAAPVRAELGIPTVFNILGPLSNPGLVKRQVVGVSQPETADLIAQVLADRGSRSLVVTGHGQLDELALTGPTRVLDVDGGVIRERTVTPADVGLNVAQPDDLAGGDAATNAAIATAIFAGDDRSPRRDIVVLNAAAGLVVAGSASDLVAGVAAANEAIDNGGAAAALARLIDVSNA